MTMKFRKYVRAYVTRQHGFCNLSSDQVERCIRKLLKASCHTVDPLLISRTSHCRNVTANTAAGQLV